MKLLDRLPTGQWLAVLVGVLLGLSTVGTGPVFDDVLVRARLSGLDTPLGRSPWWDLYTFARPDQNLALRDAGFHPWWSDPSVKMLFFRPLSAVTHVFDHALFADLSRVHSLHSVAWYGLAVAVAGVILRRIEGPHWGPLATLFFAAAAPHVSTVAWVAARNTLIAFVLSGLVLLLHMQRRRVLAACLFASGLLAGEAMLGGLAWLLAWQLWMEPGARGRRAVLFLPYGLIVLAWRLAYVRAGFGAHASGIYNDPSSEPGAFLLAQATNVPVLLLSEWTLLPLDGWAILPRVAQRALIGLGLLGLPALGLLLWPLLRSSDRARFWATGMVLAAMPFAATMPMDRLLLMSGLGAAALFAALARQLTGSRLRRAVVVGLVVLHLPLSLAWGTVRGLTTAPGLAMFRSGLDQAPADAAVAGQTFVYVNGNFHRVHYTTLMRQLMGRVVPRRSLVLSSFLTATTLTRLDDHTVAIEAEGGFMAFDLDRIHRRDPTGLPVGTVVSLPDADIEVVALTDDGRPAVVHARFRLGLDDPSLRWLVVDPGPSGGFPPQPVTREFTLPAVGEGVLVPAVLPWGG